MISTTTGGHIRTYPDDDDLDIHTTKGRQCIRVLCCEIGRIGHSTTDAMIITSNFHHQRDHESPTRHSIEGIIATSRRGQVRRAR